MKIAEYNEMMAYLLRPAQKTKLVDDLEPGSLRDELLKDFDPSQETYEEYLQRKSMRENAAQGGVIGGGAIKGEDLGSRTGFNRPRKILIDDDKLLAEWRKSLNKKNAVPWEQFLREKFGKKTANTLRARIRRNSAEKGISFNPVEEFDQKVKSVTIQKRIKDVKTLVKEHNDSDKFLYDKEEIYKKLNLAKIDPENIGGNEIINELNKLESMDKKITKAFDKIVNEDLQLYKPKGMTKTMSQYGLIKQMISDIVTSKKTSLRYNAGYKLINKALNNHPEYLKNKIDIDYLDKYHSTDFKNQNFSEALEYSKFRRGGLDIKNLTEFAGGYAKPEQNIYSFAIRNAFLNYKDGTPADVKFFKLKADGSKGAPINFDKLVVGEKGLKVLDTNKVGFEHKGQFFNKKNLKTKGFKSGLFNEVYQMSRKGQIEVPNPKNPSKKITLRKLLQDAGDKLTIAHDDSLGGVKRKPFTNLKIQGGKLNIALFNAYDKIKNKKLRKLVIDDLDSAFKGLVGNEYESAFIKGETEKVKNIAKQQDELTLYRRSGQNIIEGMASDFFKQSKPFQQEAMRVAGIKSTDDVKTIINKINKAPLPNKIKKTLIAVVYAGGAITGADFLKKTGIGFDKEFEQTASAGETPLVEKGLSTGEQTAIGAGALGTYAARKPILSTLGKIARPVGRVLGAPSVGGGLALSEFLNINPFSEEFGDLKEDPNYSIAGADLLLPELAKKVGVRGALANPFGIGRFMTPVGTALITGDTLAKRAKQMMETSDEISDMEAGDEQDSLLEEYAAKDYRGYDKGGIVSLRRYK